MPWVGERELLFTFVSGSDENLVEFCYKFEKLNWPRLLLYCIAFL